MAPAVKYWVITWNTRELPIMDVMPAAMLAGYPLRPKAMMATSEGHMISQVE